MAEVVIPPLRTLVEAHRTAIKAATERHRGRRIAVFGSVARGEETSASDIDFLVEFEAGSSLLDLVRLKDSLGHLLGRDVDVVSLGGLKARDHDIRADAIWL